MPTEHTEYTESRGFISVSSVCSVGHPPAFVFFVSFVVNIPEMDLGSTLASVRNLALLAP
jgi:hypothetical protein